MGIYIGMKKINENNEEVLYEFDMDVIDKKYYKPGEKYAYKVDTHTAYGYCTFNKKTEDFTIDQKRTDPFFLEHTYYYKLVWMKLLQFNREKKFPETACYAC